MRIILKHGTLLGLDCSDHLLSFEMEIKVVWISQLFLCVGKNASSNYESMIGEAS